MTEAASDPPPARPRTARLELALQLVCVVALGTAAMLLVDYVRPPVFCADHGSGCDLVRHSVYARPLGVPLPVPGVLHFAALLGLSVAGPRARRLLSSLGLLGIAAGVALVAIQAIALRHFCTYCLVVDASALVAGALAASLRHRKPASHPLIPRPVAAMAALLAVCAPLGYGLSRPPPRIAPNTPVLAPLPEFIARAQQPGVATIVEFVDFECPYCRRQMAALAPLLASYGGRVRVIRKNVPLSMHPHAHDAARAACCAEEQGRGETMASGLFTADDLSVEGCEALVRSLGGDVEAYRACLASQRPDVRIEGDMNDARASGVSGLPTMFVGRERFEGLTDADTLRGSIERALRTGG